MAISGGIELGSQHGEFERTKNKKARRVVLPREIVDLLAVRELMAPGGYVFWNSNGKPVNSGNAHVALRNALGDEWSWVTSHVFRKTVGTRVARAHGAWLASQQLGNTVRVAEKSYILPGVVDALK